MFKVVFVTENKDTGRKSTTISNGYSDTRIDALSYAHSVKAEHENSKDRIIDFHIIGDEVAFT